MNGFEFLEIFKNDKYIEEQKRIIKAQQEQIRKLSEMNQQNRLLGNKS